MEAPDIETQRQNVRDALEGARQDWLEADTEIEQHIQMVAIDHLLDVGIKIGAFSLEQLIDAPEL